MFNKVYETHIDVPPADVWNFHASSETLKVLTPPNRRVKLLSADSEVKDGALHEMQVWLFGIFPIVWKARISDVTPPYGFTDKAEKSPFAYWRHRHDFVPDGQGTLLRDTVVYKVPFGMLGKWFHKLVISRDLDNLFAFRHQATLAALKKSGSNLRPDSARIEEKA